jgi:hypothetical protein
MGSSRMDHLNHSIHHKHINNRMAANRNLNTNRHHHHGVKAAAPVAAFLPPVSLRCVVAALPRKGVKHALTVLIAVRAAARLPSNRLHQQLQWRMARRDGSQGIVT